MKPTKEYSILSQCEKDSGYIIRPENDRPGTAKRKSCVLISFVILAVLIIIFGALALVIGLFYSQEFTSTVNTYLNTKNHVNQSIGNKTEGGALQLPASSPGSTSKNPVVQNETMTIPNPPEVANNDHSSSSSDEGTSGDEQTTDVEKKNETNADESVSKTTEKPVIPLSTDTDEDEEDDESKEVDEDTDEDHSSSSTTMAPVTTTMAPKKSTEHPPSKKKGKHPNSAKHNSTKTGGRKEEFAETMQEMEKYFESVTGIRRAEFVIPMLMVLVFLVAFALSSCCCYLIIKKKDKERRRVLGKMITDLQAGDKGVLLEDDE